MRINNRKRLEYCSLFKCPKCGSLVIRPTGEGNRLTACSQSCSQLGVRRKSYKKSVIISGYEYVYMPEHPNAMKSGYVGKHINARIFQNSKIGVLMFHVFEDNEDVPMVELLEDDSVAFAIIGNIWEDGELLDNKKTDKD